MAIMSQKCLDYELCIDVFHMFRVRLLLSCKKLVEKKSCWKIFKNIYDEISTVIYSVLHNLDHPILIFTF